MNSGHVHAGQRHAVAVVLLAFLTCGPNHHLRCYLGPSYQYPRTMDDEDAEYMQGSDDEVRALSKWLDAYSPFKSRTTGLTTQMERVPTML